MHNFAQSQNLVLELRGEHLLVLLSVLQAIAHHLNFGLNWMRGRNTQLRHRFLASNALVFNKGLHVL